LGIKYQVDALQNKLKRRGIMLVLSSPSGAGKSSIASGMLEVEKNLEASISITTRQKRPAEIDGKDYHFITHTEFERMKSNNELLEHAKVFNNYYGTPKIPVEYAINEGNDVLFDIDWQGTEQLTQYAREDVVSIFILPPSMEQLTERLHHRAQDTQEVIAFRMARAEKEISHWREYDYIVINDDLESSVDAVHTILIAERLKRKRQIELHEFVGKLQLK
jgi:guanylate kinase